MVNCSLKTWNVLWMKSDKNQLVIRPLDPVHLQLCWLLEDTQQLDKISKVIKLLTFLCWKGPNTRHCEDGRPWFLPLSCLRNTSPEQICRQTQGSWMCGAAACQVSSLHFFFCFCKKKKIFWTHGTCWLLICAAVWSCTTCCCICVALCFSHYIQWRDFYCAAVYFDC